MNCSGNLLPINPQHIYALYYIYLSRINKALGLFCDGWKHHSLYTARNKSPYQLYTEGALQQSRHSRVHFDSVDDMYGV